jgi:hypothetical protein
VVVVVSGSVAVVGAGAGVLEDVVDELVGVEFGAADVVDVVIVAGAVLVELEVAEADAADPGWVVEESCPVSGRPAGGLAELDDAPGPPGDGGVVIDVAGARWWILSRAPKVWVELAALPAPGER